MRSPSTPARLALYVQKLIILGSGEPITDSKDVLPMLEFLRDREYEEAFLLVLDESRKLISAYRLGSGMRSAVKFTESSLLSKIDGDARYAILVHNHIPPEKSLPSVADLKATEQVRASLASRGVILIDHLIVSGDSTTSLLDSGAMG